ncbi:nitroreductase family protein [Dysgonomonas sp. Marseille-P4677]|uniref:nitroreductase family protein n=1 Tax=Dysgonomonas sp. Marseille-P4677 TaxID=2364790 RepID=UPI0019115FAB|nr:nitroreductase family protein [Dysgonomonas sp. Marseille-P4677]MBK5721858.1 nitroreductase family protein [Dysgonomonas sp. Marseille-P4677]
MNLIDTLQWRYATKKFDPTKKVDQKLVDQIIEAAWLAPTSSGLQPFKIIEITNQELKEKIVPIAYNQRQVAEGSHLLVFAAWDNYTENRIDTIYKYTTEDRGQEPNRYKDYTDRLKKSYLNRPANTNFEHTARQAYIAFGFAMAMAADLHVDSTPMEGFDSEALDNLLGLKELGLKSVTMLPLGYRDQENDWLVNMKKVRHPKKEFLIEIA